MPLCLLIVIVALGGWLRFSGVGTPAFWGDERVFTYVDSESYRPGTDDHKHGFYMIVRGYALSCHLFGASIKNEFTFRFLSASLSMLTLLMLFACGMVMRSAWSGLAASALYSVNTFAVTHARVATPPSAMVFGTTGMIIAVFLICEWRKIWGWVLLVIASSLTWYAQPYSAIYIGSVWLVVATSLAATMLRRRCVEWNVVVVFLLSSAAVSAICVPEYLRYLRPAMQAGGGIDISTSATTALGYFSLKRFFAEFISQAPRAKAVFCVLFLVGLVKAVRRHWQLAGVLGCTVLLAYLTMSTMRLGLLDNIKTFPTRYLAFLLPCVIMTAGLGFGTLLGLWSALCRRLVEHHGGLGRAALYAGNGVLAGVMALQIATDSARAVYVTAYEPLTQWREIASFLSHSASPKDIILADYAYETFSEYLTNAPCPIRQVATTFDGRDVTIARIQGYETRHPAVWSVFVGGWMRWSDSPVPKWMDTHAISLPFWSYGDQMHYWSKEASAVCTSAAVRVSQERKLVEKIVNSVPYHYLAWKRLAELCILESDTVAARRCLAHMMRMKPVDPYPYHLMQSLASSEGHGVPGLPVWKALWHACMFLLDEDKDTWFYRMAPVTDRRTWVKSKGLDALEAENLLGNTLSTNSWSPWSLWSAANTYTQCASLVNYAGSTNAVRIENPYAKLVGLQRTVSLVSGSIYRLSGAVRSVATNDSGTLFGGRIALWLPPQPEQEIVWMSEHNEWWRREKVFTNCVSGVGVVYFHMGYGNISSTGEFVDIRLELLD